MRSIKTEKEQLLNDPQRIAIVSNLSAHISERTTIIIDVMENELTNSITIIIEYINDEDNY